MADCRTVWEDGEVSGGLGFLLSSEFGWIGYPSFLAHLFLSFEPATRASVIGIELFFVHFVLISGAAPGIPPSVTKRYTIQLHINCLSLILTHLPVFST